MSSGMIALCIGLGIAGWVYSLLVRNTGNASPKQTLGGAAIAGVLAYIFIFTLLTYVLHF